MRKDEKSVIVDLHYNEEENSLNFHYAGDCNHVVLFFTLLSGNVLKKAGINNSSPECIKDICDKFAKALEEIIKT